jgi:hypothetical protein
MITQKISFCKRRLLAGFLIAVLSWFLLVPALIKQIVRDQVGVEVEFNRMSFCGVFSDVVIFSSDYTLRAKEVKIGLFPFRITFIEPHLTLREGYDLLSDRKRAVQDLFHKVAMERGIVRWGLFEGQFSFRPHEGLIVQGEQERLYWNPEQARGTVEFIQSDLTLLHTFYPIPAEILRGTITAHAEWNQEEWKVTDCVIEHGALQGHNWELDWETIDWQNEIIAIHGARGLLDQQSFSHLSLKGAIQHRSFREMHFGVHLKDLQFEGIVKGPFLQPEVILTVDGAISGSIQMKLDIAQEKAEVEAHIVQLNTEMGTLTDLHSQGSCIFLLSDDGPFFYTAKTFETNVRSGHLSSGNFILQGSCVNAPWTWSMNAALQIPDWGPFSELSLELCVDSQRGITRCHNGKGFCSVGMWRLPMRVVNATKDCDHWFFDVRIAHNYLDLLRLKGCLQSGADRWQFFFDPEETQFLNTAVHVQECFVSLYRDNEKNREFDKEAAQIFFPGENDGVQAQSTSESIKFGVMPTQAKADSLFGILSSSLQFDSNIFSVPFAVPMQSLLLGPFTVQAHCSEKDTGWTIDGAVNHQHFSIRFSGSFSSSHAEGVFDWLMLRLDEGLLQGTGTMEWKGDKNIEGDFRLQPTSFHKEGWRIENRAAMQLHYSQRQGLLLKGLDLSIQHGDAVPFDSRIGIVQFDFDRARWILHHTQIRVPHALLRSLLPQLSFTSDLILSGTFDCASDGSSINGSIREASLSFESTPIQIKQGEFQWTPARLGGSFVIENVNLPATCAVFFTPVPHGMLTLAPSMVIDWELHPREGWMFHSVEGSTSGFEASLRKEVDAPRLLGSLRFDALPRWNMGKGFELKGHFSYKPLGFQGLLSGKYCELFGAHLRTLLAQVDYTPEHLHLFDLSISDPAGILHIPSLTLDHNCLSVPLAHVKDFRPSLLRKVGQEPLPIAPLVIRDCIVTDLRGSLNDLTSLTARGTLSFSNSFKNSHTVLDLPSDVLGRIFGLDLELLIPVQGSLQAELKEGKFFLTNLEDCYSYGKRSQFFLVEPSTLDLQGNLDVMVKMKQYVLFKITERFLLSIDGNLSHPGYHLRRKSAPKL